jgi:ElaB/YqjD/DUF883 family membrane-anchored ribosome-binding protein
MEATESFAGSHRVQADLPAADKPTALDENTPADLRRAAEDVASSVEQLYRVGDAFVGRQAQDRPYVILGVAAGLGFVLGGGLASRVTGALINVVGRLAVTHAVDTWLSSNTPGGQSSR